MTAHAAGVADQSYGAADFTAFDATADISAPVGNHGYASQQSQLSPTGVTMSGRLAGITYSGYGPFGSGQTTLDTSFALNAASPYAFKIDPYLPGPLPPGNIPTVTVSVDATYNYSLKNLADNSTIFTGTGPFNFPGGTDPTAPLSGTLPAGSYALHIIITNPTYNGDVSVSSAYSASFTVPEPACVGLLVTGIGILRRRRTGRFATT